MTRRSTRQFFMVVVAMVLVLLVADTSPRMGLSPPCGHPWKLVFQEEFSGSSLDTKRWQTRYPWGRTNSGNAELQYYTDDSLTVGNGVLSITAARRERGGFAYTSGIITTYPSFHLTYGYVIIRARMASGQGLWPALWLLPASTYWPPEIDIAEVIGSQPNVVHMTTHFEALTGGDDSRSRAFAGPDFSQEFHTFAIEWEPGRIIWYADNVMQYQSYVGVPDEPMYILANLAVGGNWPGSPDASTLFPNHMEIDYVRVYQRP